MARSIPRPRRIDGKIKFAPSDGFFLASIDIMDRVPLRLRISEVVEYPAGTPRGGIPSKEPILALFLEGPMSGRRGDKPWAPNRTALWALFNRFGGDTAWWVGQEIVLDLTPRRHPTRGIVAGIFVVPLEDELDEDAVATKMARALRGECPYQAPERQPGEDPDEPPPDDFDQRTDTDDPTEPPADWQGDVQP